jgi:hypothetical protein
VIVDESDDDALLGFYVKFTQQQNDVLYNSWKESPMRTKKADGKGGDSAKRIT